jgi:copper chaperone CopZ
MYGLNIEGMTCESCKRAISTAIGLAASGTPFEIDLTQQQVRFNALSAEQVTLVRNAIRDAGYGILSTASR